ncbi:MAG: dynamin family protein [Stigonema ocellatum SAG 48.90 = DSM 106950]|nr:dynamin family protein [Stigonema ocellatum SAG 48.90 = DSM 106950]
MTIDVETILHNARSQLRELGEAVENLVTTYPDVFDDTGIRERLEAFRQAHREAVDRLETPSLSIATIGTTSSGKSTIVNALIGSKIAPIEAGEMSGGVLTLRHASKRKLVVEETEGATWETGVWSDLSDEAIYERIRDGVMRPYHDTREKRDCIAPRVTAFIPLLPASEQSLLGLPFGVGVELIDLPGLKSVQDRDNLKVIQERVHKAFSLVALDYMQVDDKHRKRLLEELKRVVEYLQGRTDSMIFILNRVDQRGADDIPISKRIEKLQQEIQEVLSLKETPEILPFNARLLYYAQCAWGSLSLNQASLVEQHTRLKLLKAMFTDCAGTIKQHISDDKELRRWFRDVEDTVDDGDNISDDTMRKLLQYALEWSGGGNLWNRLRSRVQEAFPELVLLPALIEVFENYDALETAIDTVASIRKIEHKEEIEAQQAKIQESRRRWHEAVENIREEFLTDAKNTIEDLKKNDADARSRVEQRFQKKRSQGFLQLFEAVKVVEQDLTKELISPVRDAIKNNQSAYELEEKLSNVITPVIAHDIARAYDLTSRKIDNFTHNSGYFNKRVRQDDTKGIRELEHAERAVRALYQAMREAMSVRAEFMLQAQAQKIETALKCLVKEKEEELSFFCQEFTPLKLDQAIIADFKKNTFSNLPVLPKRFFEIPEINKQRSIENTEVVGKKDMDKKSTTGSCCKSEDSRTVSRDVWGVVEYNELSLPDAETMARQWSIGIETGKQNLWDILCNWIIEGLSRASDAFDKSVNDVINLAERALQEQLRIIEENFASEMQRWSHLEFQKASATTVRQQLEKESCLSNNI